MSTANTITTAVARAKFAGAHAGTDTFPTISQIGFGTGGHNPGTGLPTQPTGLETAVGGEVVKKNITSVNTTVPTTAEVLGILDFAEGNGVSISAIGLYDSDGDLICLKHTEPSPKTAEKRMEITWKEQF
jgi:hypothetical protein